MSQQTMGQPTFGRTLLIFVGLQLGQVMSSIDGTIVATALPTIAGDIGGYSRSTWVITAYALAMVASMPIYGSSATCTGAGASCSSPSGSSWPAPWPAARPGP